MQHMDEVTFRRLSRNDIPFLRQLLSEIWEINRFTSDECASNTIISSILYGNLIRQNYAEVACIDNAPVGILLARIGTKRKMHLLWRRKYASCMKSLSTLSPQVVGEYKKVDSSFQRLLAEVTDNSELIFFMISSEVRGKGIGNALMSHYLSKCRDLCVEKFYLVTDTQCDYQYYDKAGFVLLSEESFELVLSSDVVNHRTFLYRFDL